MSAIPPVQSSTSGATSATSSTGSDSAQVAAFQSIIQAQAQSISKEYPSEKSAAQQLVNKADHTTSLATLQQIENQMNKLPVAGYQLLMNTQMMAAIAADEQSPVTSTQ
jgi:hypothetical protein